MNRFFRNSSALSLASLLTLTVSGYADAAPQQPQMTPPESPVAVVLSHPAYCFSVNYTNLIMQPTASNLDYAARANPFNYGDAQPAVSPSWVIQEIHPEFHYGFDLGISGVFHNLNSNVSLNWERLHSSKDSNSENVGNSTDMIGPFFEIGPDASAYKKSKGGVRFYFDEANLTYGTFVNFGNRLHTNLFGGVSYVRIHQHRSTSFTNDNNDPYRTIKVPSKFQGAGPQLGFDFTYKIVSGFQAVGGTRASLYVGTFKNKTNYSTASSDLVALGDESPNKQSTRVKHKSGIVPAVEGKIGLAYDYEFRGHYRVKLEAGYRVQLYLNAIQSIDMGSEVALGSLGSVGSASTGVYARTFERTLSNFGLAGPYVTLDFGF